MTWIVTAQVALLVVALATMWVRVFYLGQIDAAGLLSYRGADRPPVPAIPWQLGVHTFGDFLLPYEQALVPNPWTDYPLALSSYPPLLMLVFKVFTFLPYGLALAAFMVLCAACMLLPVAAAARRLTPPRAFVAVCLFGALSLPFIMEMDRVNAQALVVVPLYAFVVAWREQRWRRAAAALSVAMALKLYPVLLAVGLLAERRYREAAVATAAAAAVTLLLFDFFPGGLAASSQAFIAGVSPFANPVSGRFLIGNYSVLGMLCNLCAVVFGPTSAPLDWLFRHPSVGGIVYVAAAAAVVFARRLPFLVRTACALSMITLVVPLSYGYTLTFVFVVIAELLRLADDAENTLPRPLAVALAIAIVPTLAMWPYDLPVIGTSLGTILVPAGWMTLTVTALVLGYARPRAAAVQGA